MKKKRNAPLGGGELARQIGLKSNALQEREKKKS